MLRIDIAPLKAGMHEVELEPQAESIDLDPEAFRDIRVDAHLHVQEKRIVLIFNARATARLECDRTLRLFDQEIEGDHSVLFAPPEFAGADDEAYDEAYDEVHPFDPGDLYLDITDVVRDTLLLAIPQRCIAPGAEDLDLETVYGEPEDEEQIDPRWEALRRLKSGDDDPSKQSNSR